MNAYFVKLNGKIFGPFSGRKLKSMKDAGLIRQDTPVSMDRTSWRSAVDLPWLFTVADAPPVAPEAEEAKENAAIFSASSSGQEEEDCIHLVPPDEWQTETETGTPNRMEFFARVISLIWNPACHVTAIRDRFGEDGCALASVIVFLFFWLSTTLSLNLLPALKGLSLPLWKTIVLPLFLVLFLTFYTAFVRLFFGNEKFKQLHVSDFLTVGASLACWGVLLPFAGVLWSVLPAGTEYFRSVWFILLLFFFCCGATISTLCFYESWTGFGAVKKTTAAYLLPFVFFFSIFLVMIHF